MADGSMGGLGSNISSGRFHVATTRSVQASDGAHGRGPHSPVHESCGRIPLPVGARASESARGLPARPEGAHRGHHRARLMHGPDIIARTLSVSRPFGPSKQMLQYHSRSDHHSKLCCWAIAFDLLSTSSLLRQHVAEGKVCIGVNHTMVDFKTSRKKDLDLVVARPATDKRTAKNVITLLDIGESIGVELTDIERAEFMALPTVERRLVGSVLVALEAKAAATEHKKSQSRMFDELNSSQATIHGAADQAVAVGLAVVNISDTFVSPGRQAGST